jgi:hypothetical protein
MHMYEYFLKSTFPLDMHLHAYLEETFRSRKLIFLNNKTVPSLVPVKKQPLPSGTKTAVVIYLLRRHAAAVLYLVVRI